MKKVILVVIVVGIILGVFAFLWNKNTKDIEYKEEFEETFEEMTAKEAFLFPGDKILSFGNIKDEPNQIGKYEEAAKDKEEILVMEYVDKDGQEREAYIKSLDLNSENVSYTLRHFTNYSNGLALSDLEYDLKFSIDEFKKDEYKKETNSGTIVVSNASILIIMSNEETIDPFMEIFEETNDVEMTFLEYLAANPQIWSQVESMILENEAKTEEAVQKVSEELKEFAGSFWQNWIVMNTESLQDQYSDIVKFYAGDEWFEEWDMVNENEGKIHGFVDIESDRLLSAYKSLKSEDFEEDFEGMQELSDSIVLYPLANFLGLCYSENKEEFTSHFGLEEGDTIMVVRLDGGDTCTIDGKFLGGELRFFVVRDIDGEYRVVTDFTE